MAVAVAAVAVVAVVVMAVVVIAVGVAGMLNIFWKKTSTGTLSSSETRRNLNTVQDTTLHCNAIQHISVFYNENDRVKYLCQTYSSPLTRRPQPPTPLESH